MTYEAYLNGEYAGPAATVKGWGNFGRWTRCLPEDQYPTLSELEKSGRTSNGHLLAGELRQGMQQFPPREAVRSTAEGLLAYVGDASEGAVLEISDGTADDVDEDEEPETKSTDDEPRDEYGRWTSGSNSYAHEWKGGKPWEDDTFEDNAKQLGLEVHDESIGKTSRSYVVLNNPVTVYHVTRGANVDAILKNGLQPTDNGGRQVNGVYLGGKDIASYLGDEGHLLKVRLPVGTKLYQDVQPNAVLVRHPIPSKDVELVDTNKHTETKSFNGYSYASTQVNLPEPLASQITDWAAANIPVDSLHDESQGQDVPHITVKYGILDDSPASSEAALRFTGPIQATLRNMKVFRFSPSYDVLVIAVDSPDLHNANSTIKAVVPTVDTFPTYDPHVTVAYVKKGEGEAFDGNGEFSGQNLQFGSVIFSSKDGEEYEIPLNGYDFYSPYNNYDEEVTYPELEAKSWEDEPRDESGKWTTGDADTDRKLAALRWEGRKLRETLKTHEAKLKDARERGDEAAIKEHDANHRRTAIELRKLREQHHQLAGKKEYKNPYEKRGGTSPEKGPKPEPELVKDTRPEAQKVREQLLADSKSIDEQWQKHYDRYNETDSKIVDINSKIRDIHLDNDEHNRYDANQLEDVMEPLRKERSKLYEDMADAQRAMTQLDKDRIVKLRQNLYQDTSKISRKFRVVYSDTGGEKIPPSTRRAVEGGMEEFHKLAASAIYNSAAITFKRETKTRSNANGHQISLDKNSGQDIVVHELGHVLENNNPDIHKAAVAFLAKRTKGESLKPLSFLTGQKGYGSIEKARKDKFINPYMGKDYSPSQKWEQGRWKDVDNNAVYSDPSKNPATEIISMGLEYMHSQPHVLAEKDPEYFDFMYNVLRGNYDAV